MDFESLEYRISVSPLEKKVSVPITGVCVYVCVCVCVWCVYVNVCEYVLECGCLSVCVRV